MTLRNWRVHPDKRQKQPQSASFAKKKSKRTFTKSGLSWREMGRKRLRIFSGPQMNHQREAIAKETNLVLSYIEGVSSVRCRR